MCTHSEINQIYLVRLSLPQPSNSLFPACAIIHFLTLLLFFRSHCNENPIYVFLFLELRGLSPNFHIHVSVNDLYISRIGPQIFLQQIRQTAHGDIYIAHRRMSVEIGTKANQLLSGNICLEFLVLCLCSAVQCLYRSQNKALPKRLNLYLTGSVK